MKKRFTAIFIIDIILAIICMILFFIAEIGEKGWISIPVMLVIVLLWIYGLTHKSKLFLFNNKTFKHLFNFIGILALIYNSLADSKLLVIQIIAFIFLVLILAFSSYELVLVSKKKT